MQQQITKINTKKWNNIIPITKKVIQENKTKQNRRKEVYVWSSIPCIWPGPSFYKHCIISGDVADSRNTQELKVGNRKEGKENVQRELME